MMGIRKISFLLGLVLLASVAQGQTCRALEYQNVNYAVCTVDVRQQQLRLFWQDAEGSPYGSFRRVEEALRKQNRRLVFAMNAGMFDVRQAPVGLYVENGRQLRPLNLRGGPGNFHLKPNGVFYSTGRAVGVMESGLFARSGIRPQLATQSGPMLVIGGRIHPRFNPRSDSFKVRNGVGAECAYAHSGGAVTRGVRDPNTAVFVLSDRPVNFYTFASLFRDRLNCPNALYLDGSISALYSPELGRSGASLFPFGPMIGVVR